MTELNDIKSRLREYLAACGIVIGKNNVMRCPNPGHADENPSAVYYEKGKNSQHPVVWCPVCNESWNIFDVAGLQHNTTDFKEQVRNVKSVLNIPDEKKSEQEPVSLTRDAAKNIYTEARVLELFKMSKATKLDKEKAYIVNSWPYTDENNNIKGMDVRFEDGSGKKDVITFWYNGKSLKSAGAPAMIYNLYEALHSDKPLLCSEGCKGAEISRAMDYFIPVSWNRGVPNADKVDWTVFKNKEFFILYDYDLQIDKRTGELKPRYMQPGDIAASKIKKQLPQAKIIKPVTTGDGDDIEQFLQVLTPEQMRDYILDPANIYTENVDPSPPVPTESTPTPGGDLFPFKILGIGDDGKAYFITEVGRLVSYALESIGEKHCRTLCGFRFWRDNYAPGGKLSYPQAVEDLVRISEKRDFDRHLIRGRGAWRDGDKISYHDGMETIGNFDSKYHYIRVPRKDIGLSDPELDIETITKMKDIIFKLSFETITDAVRCMSWSILAPFCGALPFRPALFVTGSSSSGKTTIAEKVINPISATDHLWLNGAETTPAYLRSEIKSDTFPVVFDETEADTEKKKANKTELMTVVRSSTSDDAPNTGKGRQDGSGVTYKMRCMFCFLGIDPTVERIADANRMFQVNMAKSANQDDWKKISKELNSLISPENCRRLRAYAWHRLPCILMMGNRLVDFVRDKTRKDYRSSLGDALLLAAFFVVWCGLENPSDEQITATLDRYYLFQPPEENRDEANEIITRIMDERIEIIYQDGREKLSIIECINRIYFGEYEKEDETIFLSNDRRHALKHTLGTYGIKVTKDGYVAIRSNHHEIKKIINYGDGYLKLFKRNKNLWVEGRNESYPDKISYRCGIIKGIIKKKYEDKTEQEKVEDIII